MVVDLAEARKQVMEATGRLGGQYSPHLHPQCTHLVVQISFLADIMLLAASSFFGFVDMLLGRNLSVFFSRVEVYEKLMYIVRLVCFL